MKFRTLLFANLFRKKTRFFLTVGSFAIALFLFGFLVTVKLGLAGGVELAGADRLVVMNRISVMRHLPLSYRDRILRIPGVKYVTHDTWFGGVYQDERNFFAQYAIDPENHLKVFSEFRVPDDQWEAFLKDRQGAIVGAKTAKRFGWQIGDRIPLKGTVFPGPWGFNLDGIYRGTRDGDDETQLWLHYAAVEEWRTRNRADGQRSRIDWYTVRLDNPHDDTRVATAIDDTFRNSPSETRSDSERAFLVNWFKQMGDIESLILAIGIVVFFTLLLVTGNTMAMAVRERLGEFAVMKAMGFTGRFILFFVLTESVLVALLGGGIGLALAKAAVQSIGGALGNMLPTLYLPGKAVLSGLGMALTVGVAAGIVPSVVAMRLGVIDALRRV